MTWQQGPKEAQGLSDSKQTHQFPTFLLLFITFQLESLRFDWNVSRQCLVSVAAAHQPLGPLWLRRALQGEFLFTGQITLTGPVRSINYKPKLIRKHHICNERGTARLALYSHFTSLLWYRHRITPGSSYVCRLDDHTLTGKHRLPQRVWSVVGAAASGPVFVAVQRAGKDSSDRLIFSWPWNPP